MPDTILFETRGPVIWATLDRPEKRNAITQNMYGQLADALEAYGSNDSSRAFVLTGAADYFTAGNDLGDFSMGTPDGSEPHVTRFLRAIADCPKPLIAAVNGPAIGVGLTMLLHFDLAFAARRATFSAPFARLAVVPEAASSLLLPATVGMAVANDILLAGRTLSSDEALNFGLVSRLFDDNALAGEVATIADEVAGFAPVALRRAKSLIRHQRDRIAATMATEGKLFADQLGSPEFAESIAALMEKRAAVYR